jgi:hypothetical protein
MADPADLVKLKLIFWHGTKKPGDIVEVRRDAVRSWHGFAVPVDDEPEPAAAEADSTPAAPKTPAAAASKAK